MQHISRHTCRHADGLEKGDEGDVCQRGGGAGGAGGAEYHRHDGTPNEALSPKPLHTPKHP